MKTIVCVVMFSLVTSTAYACGGFFCSSSSPVNQAAERIIFAKNTDGSVTSVVQILYQGPSTKFSWVLPVPSVPQIAVSSNAAFQRLQARTNPLYRLQTTTEGTCSDDQRRSVNLASNAPSAGPNEGDQGNSVAVLAKGNVGPYDYEVIQVSAAHADKAQVAVDWLSANGYDVTAVGPALLRPYLEQGDLLLAFRLSKTSDTGDIRPVWLTFTDDRPMIPIKLTAVAAQPDMGVMVWVLGNTRSVPANYRHLEPNEAAIDWLNSASNYNAVVNLAADEAGGQGFVTEYADAASTLANTVVQQFEQQAWEHVKQQSWTGKTKQLAIALAQFASWDAAGDVIGEYISAQSLQNWLLCPDCGNNQNATVTKEDAAGLLAAFEARVVKPMLDTEALLGKHAYITRMYSTLSAAEMTVDPEFDYNPDLPTLSNIHVADRVIECNVFTERANASWRVKLADGNVVRGQGNTWPLAVGQDVPANSRILQLSTSGAGELVRDNSDATKTAINTTNRRVSGCGCGSSVSPPLLLLFAYLVWATKRSMARRVSRKA